MRACGVWMAVLAFVASTEAARAASLVLDAPDTCVDPTTLGQEVADLVGRPLGEVPDVDFRLAIRPTGDGRWRSTLESIEHRPGAPETRHVRELEARSCADLGEAAALAMSVSIRAVAETAAPPPPSPPPPAPVADATIVRTPPRPAVRPAWYGLASVSVAADAGELPGVGLGVALSVGAGRGATRADAFGGWLPPRDTTRPDGTGGSFQLGYGGLEGCFAPTRGRWTALGCAGGELGVQHGTGLNVVHPTTGAAFWRAVRASLGF
ncbi:MAG TPA: hypothetical protein VMT03_19190, partial [Polyangia bacterium]|nr:hypothetical protein [Polyangia bacterium]